jgi:hypothetical protein
MLDVYIHTAKCVAWNAGVGDMALTQPLVGQPRAGKLKSEDRVMLVTSHQVEVVATTPQYSNVPPLQRVRRRDVSESWH